MTTTSLVQSLAQALYLADPNRIADVLRVYGLGLALSPQKYTWVGATNATAVDITQAGFLSLAVPGTKTPTLPQGMLNLPPILHVIGLRVTTGPSGAVGTYQTTDQGGTSYLCGVVGASGAQFLGAPGQALLSDDGKTLTFPAAISGFVLTYVPRSLVDVLLPFEHA